MSQPLLVPIHVEAKVLQKNMVVASATSEPFSNGSITLGKGIHLHWAIPSALTTGQTVKTAEGEALVFPGIPDIWLVVRFNPPNGQKRDWKAWIVDSTTRKAKELKDYIPPSANTMTPEYIHTTPKTLPRADEMFGMPGWGYWTGSEFNPASNIYYPDNINRLGFYDDLSDLTPLPTLQAEKLSYTVIGWYSHRKDDPLAMSKNRRKLLERWKWRDDSIRFPFTRVAATTNPTSINTSLGGRPLSITLQDPPSSLSNLYKAKASLHPHEFDLIANIPDSIICHGSVLGVERNNAASVKPRFDASNVLLSLNMKRALAEATKADASKLDILETLMNDASDSFTTDRDLTDVQGLDHALTFQGQAGRGKLYFQLNIMFTAGPTRPSRPTDEDIKEFGDAIKSRINNIKNSHSELPIQDRLIRVSITEPVIQISTASQPEKILWIDIEDKDALLKLYKLQTPRATVSGLSISNLHEISGERWYYPSSPHLVLTGVGRNYHTGYDTRFDPAGILRCRSGGRALTALNIKYKQYFKRLSGPFPIRIPIPDHPILGSKLINQTSHLAQYPFIPGIAQGLLEECMLLDTTNASLMGAIWKDERSPEATRDLPDIINYFGLTIDSLIFIRQYRPDKNEYQKLKNVPAYTGTLPSPIAITQWQPTWIPLMVDTAYTYVPYPLARWQIGGVKTLQSPEENPLDKKPLPADMELTASTTSPRTNGEIFQERNILSSSITSIWESVFFNAKSTDEQGKIVSKRPKVTGIDSTQDMDILSAALVGFDNMLDKKRIRERAGTINLENIKIIDIFGETADFNRNTPLNPLLLTPRLPYWSRLQFRLTSAKHDNTDATDTDSPLCGYLVPDLVEHSLEIYDDNGVALGQIVGDAPVEGVAQIRGQKLKSRFVPLPWIIAENASGNTNPLSVINNPHLRNLVAGIIAQETIVPSTAPPDTKPFSETTLTAFIRMIETMRLTVDSNNPVGQWKLRFMGDPVAVIRSRMWVESTPEKNPQRLKQNPETWETNEVLPTIQVKVGDESRPNDGVLGCFIPNNDAKSSRFTCTSNLAISHAIFKSLSGNNKVITTRKITHDFFLPSSDNLNDPIKGDAIFALKVGDKPVHLTILQDLHGGICLTSGVLPRKQITIPAEFIKNSEETLKPSIHAGPVMAILQEDDLSLIPPITKIGEYNLEWMQSRKPTSENNDTFTKTLIPEVPKVGAVPPQRIVFSSGWLTLNKQKEES